jgi:xeroderma pigmentosum group C-complementing protein
MPPRKKAIAKQPAQATRQSARQRGKAKDDIPDVYEGMVAEAAEEEEASASRPKPFKRKPTPIARRTPRRRGPADHEIGGVYGDMLAEALAEEHAAASNPRPAKRLKTSEEPSSKIELDINLFDGPADVGNPAPTEPEPTRLQQVTLTEFDTATESDEEFEDVDLEPLAGEAKYDDEPDEKPLELNLAKVSTPTRATPKRKPVSAAEKRLRLDVHKAHIILLLANLKCRNQWCNSESVQAILKPLVQRKTTSLLHVDERKSQYERNQSFMKGIEEVCAIWKSLWTVDGRGMTRAYWREDVDAVKESDDAEDLDFDDFKAAAVSKRGSRDLAAQLFCALLRSIALDARLVSSLQVLPFSRVAKGQTPQKPKAEYIRAPPQDYGSTSGPSAQRRKVFPESMFPIFWVEVFSPAIQTWIPLDPTVRQTINKPKTGFEPYGNDNYNKMTYVIAFEDDGSAKDVTRRYTQFYNSKIRKQRIESTPGGEKWWDKTMRFFEKPFREARDDIEDASLQARTESEPMPNNIEDFRGHSVYVLERHLRKNEVIHPRRESGKVRLGFGKEARLVSVFRRRDVHVCRTADAWYRRGRDVNEGEQPLKRAVPRRKRTPAADGSDEDEEAASGTALYAEYQTSLYEPPPVVNGKVPRNAYGNLDVYVASMIPAGAVHIRHPLAAKAARILGADYADAVTGFQFKGRQGTAVIDGVIVAMNMTTAMITVVEALESQASEEAEVARTKILLAIWKRWLTALRVREHVQQQYGDREEGAKGKRTLVHDDDDNDDDVTYRPEDDGGGFMLEEAEPDQSDEDAATVQTPSKMINLRPLELPPEVVHQEIIVVPSPHKLPQPPTRQSDYQADVSNTADGGGFIFENGRSTIHAPGNSPPGAAADQEGGGFLPEDEDGVEGGGFLLDDKDEASGGFVAETEASIPHAQVGTACEETAGGFFPETDADSGLANDAAAATAGNEAASTAVGSPGFNTRHKYQDARGRDIGEAATYVLPTDVGASAAEPRQSTPAPALALEPDQATLDLSQTEAANRGSPASAPTPGSLLSHDPEEDDAEPEWLLNSLGEMD